MLFSKFASDIKEGRLEPVYFITGAEPFLHHQARLLLKSALLANGSEDFDLEILEGDELELDRFFSALRTLPLISSSRLLMVKRFDLVDSRYYRKILDVLQKEKIPRLVITFCYEDKLPKSGILGEFSDKFCWVDASTPRSREFSKMLQNLLPGKEIDASLTGFLAESGADLWQINIWLQQAAALTEENESLTLDKVQELVDLGGITNFWSLEDAIGARDVKKAQILLQDLLRFREKPNNILWRLKDLFIHLHTIGKIKSKDKNPFDFQKEIGLHQFRLKRYISASNNYSLQQLESALIKIQEADLRFKSSGGEPETILIELVDGIVG